MNTRTRTAAALAAVFATVTLTACEALVLGDGLSDGVCIVDTHNPHRSHHDPDRINATVVIECDKSTDWMSVRTELQRKSHGEWLTIVGNYKKWWNTPKNREYRLGTSTPCNDGAYRLRARVSAQREGLMYGPSDWKVSQEDIDPCAPGK